jgi:hypothetical protein
VLDLGKPNQRLPTAHWSACASFRHTPRGSKDRPRLCDLCDQAARGEKANPPPGGTKEVKVHQFPGPSQPSPLENSTRIASTLLRKSLNSLPPSGPRDRDNGGQHDIFHCHA